ncbi:prolyl-tRNA synthetase [[Clostridium] ultunense Esp]|nr:prolyl-tRNA synthetase [[Clostridium] ultunense Esp]
MRQSHAFIPTLRDLPADAEVVSHQLMLRAGMMRQISSGVYTYLPLGYRVIKKVSEIIREEMDRAGGQELLMPALQPAELWMKTGRWDDYGPLMMKVTDRHERPFALGPTHEEVITSIVRDEVKTYKKLPFILYQIQTKFRDEYRPRFGLLRGREFIMKDAYSFDTSEEGLDRSYKAMYDAYVRIFTRCGLKFRAVEADSGAIGGKDNHEFMVLASIGEDTIAYCSSCSYAANLERAEVVHTPNPSDEEPQPLRKVTTPGVRTVAKQAEMMGIPVSKVIKNVVFSVEGKPVVVLVRGDHEVNEVKVKNFLNLTTLEMADEETIRKVFGCEPGFVSPIGIEGITVLADRAIKEMVNASTGANETDYHHLGVQPERDFHVDHYGDFRNIREGDPCPRCGAPIRFTQGIEVGHVFKLRTKYSSALGAVYQDEKGNLKEMLMGSYGIGVSRLVAAVVEQSHDENGMIWPKAIAPFAVHLVPVNIEDAEQREFAERLYGELQNQGIEVLFDDRNERAGVKFKDSDLLGIPLRVVIGSKIREGKVELKIRRTGESMEIPSQDALPEILRVWEGLE